MDVWRLSRCSRSWWIQSIRVCSSWSGIISGVSVQRPHERAFHDGLKTYFAAASAALGFAPPSSACWMQCWLLSFGFSHPKSEILPQTVDIWLSNNRRKHPLNSFIRSISVTFIGVPMRLIYTINSFNCASCGRVIANENDKINLNYRSLTAGHRKITELQHYTDGAKWN